ncbi:MAG: hypothetical protein WD492_06645 [Alkalispirochaeta sp.]
MTWDEVALQKLRSELQLDIERLTALQEKNVKAANRVSVGTPDELDYAALGYTIHNCFNLIENYAMRIAKLFENQVDPTSWHRDLIERMQIDIRGVRPALWDRQLARKVDELRRFRYVFRNMYANDLDPHRVVTVQETLPETISLFFGAHDRFIHRLDLMIDQVSSEE